MHEWYQLIDENTQTLSETLFVCGLLSSGEASCAMEGEFGLIHRMN